MKDYGLFDKYLLAKPTTRMRIEWPVLIITGIIGMVFSLKNIPLYPILNIIGVIILILGVVIHLLMHKVHKQAHQQSEEIKKLVTAGIYSKIRHPGYSSLTLMYLGFALAWGKVIILIPASLFIILTLLTAFREEIRMKEKFKEEYEEYTRRVPWRFIPHII